MPLMMASGNAADDVCSYSGACFLFFRSTAGTYNSSRSSVLIFKIRLVLAPARAAPPASRLCVFAGKISVGVPLRIPPVPSKSHAWRVAVRWEWRDLTVQPQLTIQRRREVLYLFLFDSHIHARGTRIMVVCSSGKSAARNLACIDGRSAHGSCTSAAGQTAIVGNATRSTTIGRPMVPTLITWRGWCGPPWRRRRRRWRRRRRRWRRSGTGGSTLGPL